MEVQEQIDQYIKSLPEKKRLDIEELHRITIQVKPDCKIWFFDGKNEENRTVANPTIGYGELLLKYANGTSRESFKVGISANSAGISVYILGLKDKQLLTETYGKSIGKASVTGYCIKFKALKDINIDVLENAIRFGLSNENC